MTSKRFLPICENVIGLATQNFTASKIFFSLFLRGIQEMSEEQRKPRSAEDHNYSLFYAELI